MRLIWAIWAEALIVVSCILIITCSAAFFYLRHCHPLKGRIPSVLLAYNFFLLLYLVQQSCLVLFSHPVFFDVWFGFLLLCVCSGLYVYRAIRILFLLEIAKNLVESHFSQGARLGWYVQNRFLMHPGVIRKVVIPIILLLYCIVPLVASFHLPLTEIQEPLYAGKVASLTDQWMSLLMWGTNFWCIVHLLILGIVTWKMRGHVDDMFSVHSEIKWVFRLQSIFLLCHIVGTCLGMSQQWWWSWFWTRPPQWASFFGSTVWPMAMVWKWYREEDLSMDTALPSDYDLNTLEHLLLNEEGFSAFVAFLRQEFNSEMALFWREVYRFKNNHKEALLLLGPQELLENGPTPTQNSRTLKRDVEEEKISSPFVPSTTNDLSASISAGPTFSTPNSSPSLLTSSFSTRISPPASSSGSTLLSSSSTAVSNRTGLHPSSSASPLLYTALPPSPPLTTKTLSPASSSLTSPFSGATSSTACASPINHRMVYLIYSEALRIWDRFVARDAPFEISIPDVIWNEIFAIIHYIRTGGSGDQSKISPPEEKLSPYQSEIIHPSRGLHMSPSGLSSLKSPSLGDVTGDALLSSDSEQRTPRVLRSARTSTERADRTPSKTGSERGGRGKTFWSQDLATPKGEIINKSSKPKRGSQTTPRSRFDRLNHGVKHFFSLHKQDEDLVDHSGKERVPFLLHRRYRSKSLPTLFLSSGSSHLFSSSKDSIPVGRGLLEDGRPPPLDNKVLQASSVGSLIHIYDENKEEDDSSHQKRPSGGGGGESNIKRNIPVREQDIDGRGSKIFEDWDNLDNSDSNGSIGILRESDRPRDPEIDPDASPSPDDPSDPDASPVIVPESEPEKVTVVLDKSSFQTPKSTIPKKNKDSMYPDFVYSDPPSHDQLSPCKTPYAKTPTDLTKSRDELFHRSSKGDPTPRGGGPPKDLKYQTPSKLGDRTPREELRSSLKKIVRSVTEHAFHRVSTQPTVIKLEKIDARMVLHAFDDAQIFIYNQMKMDAFVRFRRTSTFVRIATRQATQRSAIHSRNGSRDSSRRSSKATISAPRVANSLSEIQPRVNQILHQAIFDASTLIDDGGSSIQLTDNNKLSIQRSNSLPPPIGSLISTISASSSLDHLKTGTTGTSGNLSNFSTVASSNLSNISTDSHNNSMVHVPKKHGVPTVSDELRPTLLSLFSWPDVPPTRDTTAPTSRETSTNQSGYASTIHSPEHSMISRGHPSAQSSKRSSAVFSVPPSISGSVNPSPRSSVTSSQFLGFSNNNLVSPPGFTNASYHVGGSAPSSKRNSSIVFPRSKIGVHGAPPPWGGKIINSFEAVLHPTVELQDFHQDVFQHSEA